MPSAFDREFVSVYMPRRDDDGPHYELVRRASRKAGRAGVDFHSRASMGAAERAVQYRGRRWRASGEADAES